MPPPGALAAFGEIDPSYPDRILAMAEAAARHEQDIERRQVESVALDMKQARSERRVGQICAASLAALGLCSALVGVLYGHETFATAVGTTTVLGLVAVFVTGRAQKPANKRRPDSD